MRKLIIPLFFSFSLIPPAFADIIPLTGGTVEPNNSLQIPIKQDGENLAITCDLDADKAVNNIILTSNPTSSIINMTVNGALVGSGKGGSVSLKQGTNKFYVWDFRGGNTLIFTNANEQGPWLTVTNCWAKED